MGSLDAKESDNAQRAPPGSCIFVVCVFTRLSSRINMGPSLAVPEEVKGGVHRGWN
jgi:hypothetical protein